MELQFVEFFLFATVPDLGDELFGGEGEVGLHHPVVVGRFLLEDLLDRFALVLAEVEHLAVLGIVADVAHEVGPLAVGGEAAEGCDVVDDGLGDVAGAVLVVDTLVAVQLGFEHLVGGDGVGGGGVGVLEVLLAVELVGGDEGALLHLVENVLHIDQTAAGEVEVEARTEELLDEQGHVELVAVVAREVGVADVLHQAGGQLLEGGLVLDVVVGDAVDGGGLFGDVDGVALGVDRAHTLHAGVGAVVGHDLVEAYLDDVVVAHLHTGGFEVEEDDGFGEVEFHGCFLGSFLRDDYSDYSYYRY